MSEDLMKVVLDYNSADIKERDKISTGNFIKIHEGGIVDINYIPNNS